jgi:hypothetical protein
LLVLIALIWNSVVFHQYEELVVEVLIEIKVLNFQALTVLIILGLVIWA